MPVHIAVKLCISMAHKMFAHDVDAVIGRRQSILNDSLKTVVRSMNQIT